MIDFRKLAGQAIQDAEKYVHRVRDAVMAEWREQAGRMDASIEAIEEYKNAIVSEDRNGGIVGAVVALVGGKVNAIEHGFGAGGIGTTGTYDMRDFLIGGPATKIAKAGHRYVRVPIDPPEVIRTASEAGGPWLARGVEPRGILTRVLDALPRIMERVR